MLINIIWVTISSKTSCYEIKLKFKQSALAKGIENELTHCCIVVSVTSNNVNVPDNDLFFFGMILTLIKKCFI